MPRLVSSIVRGGHYSHPPAARVSPAIELVLATIATCRLCSLERSLSTKAAACAGRDAHQSAAASSPLSCLAHPQLLPLRRVVTVVGLKPSAPTLLAIHTGPGVDGGPQDFKTEPANWILCLVPRFNHTPRQLIARAPQFTLAYRVGWAGETISGVRDFFVD